MRSRITLLIRFAVLFAFVVLSSIALAGQPHRVIIFYTDIGGGHLSAAKAVEAQIKEQDPTAEVILKNGRDFMNPIYRNTLGSGKLFWFIVKKYPNLFDKLFANVMKKGQMANSVLDVPSEYSGKKMLQYIEETKPTSIISTHHFLAESLGNLREQGHLRDTPIGWVHTDYYKGYFPRFSQRLDMTFLPHVALDEIWQRDGVPAHKISVTGMPISSAIFTPADRQAILKEQKLDPNVKTIVLTSGAEGVGDYVKIVESIAKAATEKIQIVAVCGRSDVNFKGLTKIQAALKAKNVDLKITKLLPNAQLLGLIKSSDVYITKSGGLSPSEGFVITKPMALLDVYGGGERVNAQFFEDTGLALINRDYEKIGTQVQQLLTNVELQRHMFESQVEYRNTVNIKKIADFALSNNLKQSDTVSTLGVEDGTEVSNADEALDRLEKESPADVEILLSYGKFPKNLDKNLISSLRGGKIDEFLKTLPNSGFLDDEGNPFGHMAIRVGQFVYTINGKAELNVEHNLVHVTPLKEYLYGVKRHYQNEEHTDTFGESYGRNVISLRVNGLKPEAVATMLNEAAVVDQEWLAGNLKWTKMNFNCADFVIRLLTKAGYPIPEGAMKKNPTFPLDVLDQYIGVFEGKPETKSEVVSYARVPDSKNLFALDVFPLSIHQLKRSLKNVYYRLANNYVIGGSDPLLKKVGKRIAFYPGETTAFDRAYYENVSGSSERVAEKDRRTLPGVKAECRSGLTL